MCSKIKALLVVLAIAASTCLTPVCAQHKGEKSVGLRGGFTTRNTTATAGLYFSYRFKEHFRVSPKLDYAFPHHDADAFLFDIDFEMPYSLSADDKWSIYPLAGLNYSTYSTHVKLVGLDETQETSQRSNEFGLAIGSGLEFRPTATLRLALEAKGIVIRKYTGGLFNLSIGYVF